MKKTAHGIRFSATDLAQFVDCEHATWLDGQVVLGLREEPVEPLDPMLELLMRRGREHEQAYLATLGDTVVRVPHDPHVDKVGAIAATREAMRAGAPFVYQAVLATDGWLGIADFLERVEAPSDLGAWSYEVADTKLGKSTKPEYLLQLSLYSDLVREIQGVAPERMHVVLADQVRASFNVREYAAYVRALRARLAASVQLALAQAPYPMPVEHCAICRWTTTCETRWKDEDHLSGVANIRRRQIARLEAAGVRTMAELAAVAGEQRVPKMAEGTLATLAAQARLQVRQRTSGEPCYELLPPVAKRGFALLPAPSPGDVFFDMEGDPYVKGGGLEYLFGYEQLEDGGWTYRALWGHDGEGERKAFEAFVDAMTARFRDDPGMHIYHYAAYEPTALKRLAGKYGTREDALDELLRAEVFVDLYRVVRQALRASFPSYSIKDIEHFYMGAREADVKDAGSSIVAYEQWVESGEGALLESIRRYNAEDCTSTRLLRDWLLPLAAEARAKFGDAPAPPAGPEVRESKDPAKAEAKRLVKERILAETKDLEARLLAGLSGDPAALAGVERARWLLAQLLEYHQREARPVWWAYFDRVAMLPEQVIEDSESIGGLEPDPDVEPVPEKRSLVYTLRFPAQDFKLSALKDVRDEYGNGAGDLLEARVDGAGGHARLKRGPSFKDRPLPKALIPGEPIPTETLRDALRRLARSVLAHGVSGNGPYRAARDLLRALPPRVFGVAPGEPLQGTHLDVERAWAIVRGLVESPLVVQGPPGSGKTWMGARLIVRLMREGKVVGVTAPTHRVIHNLLDEVEKVALEEGVEFKGVKKCRDSEGESAFESKLALSTIRNVEELDEVPEGVQLVAGTAWLFSKEGFDQAVDVLFVDEAGQVSIADALAVGLAARNLVLLGDPQQLPQVVQGTHPEGAAASVLEHLLGGHDTVPPERGLFLEQSRRMHPDVCRFISELAYEQRLSSATRCEPQRIDSPGLSGTGLRWLPVAHEGNRQQSTEEAEAIARAIEPLLEGTFTDPTGVRRPMTVADILVVAPYNAQVQEILEHVPQGVRVGTVDKFQGQEAPVVFFSMASSSGEDLPRDLSFLFSRNRLNVAISRAQALAVLVASPRLLQVRCKAPAEMKLVNGVARFVELS